MEFNQPQKISLLDLKGRSLGKHKNIEHVVTIATTCGRVKPAKHYWQRITLMSGWMQCLAGAVLVRLVRHVAINACNKSSCRKSGWHNRIANKLSQKDNATHVEFEDNGMRLTSVEFTGFHFGQCYVSNIYTLGLESSKLLCSFWVCYNLLPPVGGDA